jgi:hypothetical protein
MVELVLLLLIVLIMRLLVLRVFVFVIMGYSLRIMFVNLYHNVLLIQTGINQDYYVYVKDQEKI